MREPERSAQFEREFLEQVARTAQVWDQSLHVKQAYDAVQDRLRKGAREYGPSSFVTADRRNVDEEGADLIAWPLLFAQVSLAEGNMEDVEDYVFIAACGLQAWLRAQRIHKRRRADIAA